MRELSYSSTIPDFGSRWSWFVSFNPRPLYPLSKSSRYPIDRGLGGPKFRSESWKKRKILHCREWTRAVQPLARLYLDWAIPTFIYLYKDTVNSKTLYIAENGKMISELVTRKGVECCWGSLFEVIYRNSSGETGENNEQLQSGWAVFRPWFEYGTSRC
jgi:hypothetical protein